MTRIIVSSVAGAVLIVEPLLLIVASAAGHCSPPTRERVEVCGAPRDHREALPHTEMDTTVPVTVLGPVMLATSTMPSASSSVRVWYRPKLVHVWESRSV